MGEIMNMVAPAIIALILAFFGIRVVIKSRADKKQALELLDEDPVEPEATSAVVIEKQVGEFYSGGKVRRYNMAFYVKFAKDDGSEVICDVPQEKYAEIYVGKKGILVTAGEQFIDFGE